jgi:membrane protein
MRHGIPFATADRSNPTTYGGAVKKRLGESFGLLKETVDDFFEDDCPMHAAALSYYTIFALPPLLALLLMLAGFVWDPTQIQGAIESQVRDLVGENGAAQVRAMLEHRNASADSGIFPKIIGVGLLIFGATGAFLQLQKSLNRAWEVEPVPGKGQIRDFLTKRLFSFGLIVGIFFLMMVSLVVTAALSALGEHFGGGLPKSVMLVLNSLVAFGVITVLFAAMFKVLPDAEMELRDVWVGAVVTALLFMIGKFALGYYLGRSDPGSAFGAAGSLAVILIWIYYASWTVLFGAELTQAWVERYGSGIRPEEGASFVVERKERVRPRLSGRSVSAENRREKAKAESEKTEQKEQQAKKAE